MSRKWSRLLKIGLPVLLVAGLATGLAGTVLASPKHATVNVPAAGKVVTGNVTSKGADSFVVQSANQTLTAVSVNATTKFFQVPRALPNRFAVAFQRMDGRGRMPLQRTISSDINAVCKLSKNATFADLAVGDKVVVRLFAGSNVAKEVLIVKPLPAPPARNQTVTGTLATFPTNTGNGGTLQITPTGGGAAVQLNWDSTTRFVLNGVISFAPSQKVTAVYNPTTLKAINVSVAAP